MAENALYYPYIHVRNLDWLKGTLLLFNQVHRMMPRWGLVAADDPRIEPFTRGNKKTGRALLEPAQLWTPGSCFAQERLAEKLIASAGDPKFMAKFGMAATLREKRDPYGFQIHEQKLVDSLRRALHMTRLSWEPRDPRFRDGRQYVELHPRVGQAVMATLAIACARDGGFDIVTDQGAQTLHQCLLEKDQNAVYDAWLAENEAPLEPRSANAQELFEYVIAFRCDITKLEPEDFGRIDPAREALRKLAAKLGEHAATIDPMTPGPRRDERIRDEVSTILARWNEDKATLKAFRKEFLGEGLVDSGAKFLEKVSEKALAGGAAGAAGGAAAGSAIAAAPMLVGAGIGLGIGLVVHAGKSMAKIRKREKDSPYRYLTIMQDAGVVIRSDLLRSDSKAQVSPE